MSRIDYGDDWTDDPYFELRCSGWEANTRRALNGKRGQKALRELEAALLALPEKRLIEDGFVDEHGDVCPLAALCLKRELDSGKSKWEAIDEIDSYIGSEARGDQAVESAADFLGITPEERYEQVLAWVRRHILPDAKP